MTAAPARHLLWDRFGRSLRPTYGARANAADGLRDLRATRRVRAESVQALARPASPSSAGHELPGRSQR